jgi:hypothetical protein
VKSPAAVPTTTTPTQRVAALRKAIAELQRGDLEAVLDLDDFVRNPLDYVVWYQLRNGDDDYDDDEETQERDPDHLRFFAPEKLEGISGHVFGLIFEFYLIHIAGAAERGDPSSGRIDIPLMARRAA